MPKNYTATRKKALQPKPATIARILAYSQATVFVKMNGQTQAIPLN